MGVAPKFKVDDVVYIAESAILGELEAYRVGAIHQRTPGVWVYQFLISQKPPTEQTVGDRIDLKTTRELFFQESELIPLCEAVDLALSNVGARINRAQNLLDACLGTEPTGTGTGSVGSETPPQNQNQTGNKFNIDEQVFLKSSAAIGFIEAYKVISVHKVPGNAEFTYKLDLTGHSALTTADLLRPARDRRDIFFKERELLDKCDAISMTLDALDRKITRLIAIKMSLCVEPSAESTN